MIKQGGLFIGNPDTFFLIFQKKRKISLSHTFCFRYGLHRDQSAGFQEYITGMPGSAGAGYDSLLILLPPGDRYPNHQSPGPGKR